MRRASIGLLLASALFVSAPPAWATSRDREVILDGFGAGEVTLSWHGDPARGCADAGVCDISGSMVLRPEDISINGVVRPNGRFYPASASLFSLDPAVVRVQRRAPDGSPSLCLDLIDATDLALVPTELPGARYSFGISNFASFGDGFSAGRCAGPLPDQLKGVFPTGMLGAPSKRHRWRSFDMSGRQPVAAGPFSGELVSTVQAQLYPSADEESSSGDSGSGRHHPARTVRVAEVDFQYRLANIAGSLVTSFSGASEPFCRPFDACGLQGTASYAVATSGGSIELFAGRILRGHERATRRSILRDLRAGRLGVGGDGLPRDGAIARISASLHRTDGSTCTDSGETVALPPMLADGRKSLRIVLGAPELSAGDALRTNCPGPTERDVLGSRGSLAEGSVPSAALTAKELRVHMTPGGPFETQAYTGSRSGAIDLDLVRTRMRIRVSRMRLGE